MPIRRRQKLAESRGHDPQPVHHRPRRFQGDDCTPAVLLSKNTKVIKARNNFYRLYQDLQ